MQTSELHSHFVLSRLFWAALRLSSHFTGLVVVYEHCLVGEDEIFSICRSGWPNHNHLQPDLPLLLHLYAKYTLYPRLHSCKNHPSCSPKTPPRHPARNPFHYRSSSEKKKSKSKNPWNAGWLLGIAGRLYSRWKVSRWKVSRWKAILMLEGLTLEGYIRHGFMYIKKALFPL
jgi:hypothetical protein